MLKKILELGFMGVFTATVFCTGVIMATETTMRICEDADKSQEDFQKFLTLQEYIHDYRKSKEELFIHVFG